MVTLLTHTKNVFHPLSRRGNDEVLLDTQTPGVDREDRVVLNIGVSFVFLSKGFNQWQRFQNLLNQTL